MPVIDSSVAAADAAPHGDTDPTEGPGTPATPPSRGRWREPVEAALLALLIGALVAIMFATHRIGHWWGDDWALYIRQAQGLLDGHPNRVLEENEFTVTMSRGAAFSPPLYPWGFPLLLAPFIAVVGADVDALAVVPVLSACVFAWCWYALARPRIGQLPALVGVAAVTITPLLLSWTELIQSEWPFLAAVGVPLVALDRIARTDALVGRNGRVAPLIMIGLLAAAVFTVRREGLAMVGAIGAAQLAALWAAGLDAWFGSARETRRLVARLALPHATFLAGVGLLQITLPSTVVPRYDGTSVTNAWSFRGRLARNLGQVSGLQRPWDRDPVVLGSSTIGWVALLTYLVLALDGGRARRAGAPPPRSPSRRVRIGAYLIGGSFRSPINRYVATVAPVLMLLALVTLMAILRRFSHRHVAAAVVTTLLLGIVAGNLANAKLRIEGAQRTEDVGAIEWGPTHPDAIAMFDAVTDLTEPDDVVAAPKARAMVLETGRLAVQVDDYRPIPDGVDLALIVIEHNQDRRLAETVAAQPDRYRLMWENPRFRLYEPLSTP